MLSVRYPPTSGPTTLARPNVAATMPVYFARSAGEKRSAMTANAVPVRIPPPMPWKPRKRISWVMSWDTPQRAEPARKAMMPVRNTRLRPSCSESLPTMGTTEVLVSR